MLFFVLDHAVHLSILIILALSLNLINGFTGMFSLGHHGFFAVGAYAAAAFVAFTLPAAAGAGLGVVWFALSVLVGVSAAALFGFVVGVPCLRLKGDYLAIATLGFGEIVRIVVQNTEAVGGARGMEIDYLLVTRSVDTQLLYVGLYLGLAVAGVALTALVIRNLLRSTHGRALIAIREDEIAAELLGVNLTRYKVLAFVLGAGLAGLGGALYANYMTQIEPREFNLLKGMATALLYVLDKVVLNLMPPAIQDWREVMFALMLVVLMIGRPQGLLGSREINDTALWRRLLGRGEAA
jgi:branched-chain amino acid transport system permease protein